MLAGATTEGQVTLRAWTSANGIAMSMQDCVPWLWLQLLQLATLVRTGCRRAARGGGHWRRLRRDVAGDDGIASRIPIRPCHRCRWHQRFALSASHAQHSPHCRLRRRLHKPKCLRRHRNTHRRVSKLPVGRARPRPSRVLEPLVVREERRIVSCMRRPACPLLVAVISCTSASALMLRHPPSCAFNPNYMSVLQKRSLSQAARSELLRPPLIHHHQLRQA